MLIQNQYLNAARTQIKFDQPEMNHFLLKLYYRKVRIFLSKDEQNDQSNGESAFGQYLSPKRPRGATFHTRRRTSHLLQKQEGIFQVVVQNYLGEQSPVKKGIKKKKTNKSTFRAMDTLQQRSKSAIDVNRSHRAHKGRIVFKKNQKKRHFTSDPSSVDTNTPKDMQQYQLYKKMEYFLKPYYKEYYTEKQHMEFSDQEKDKIQVEQINPAQKQSEDQILPTQQNQPPQKKQSLVQKVISKLKRSSRRLQIDSSRDILEKIEKKVTPKVTPSNKNQKSEQYWAKVSNFILKVKGGEFQKKLKKLEKRKEQEYQVLKLKQEREQQERQKAAQIRQRGLVKIKQKPLRVNRRGSVLRAPDDVFYNSLASVINMDSPKLPNNHKNQNSAERFRLPGNFIAKNIDIYDKINSQVDAEMKAQNCFAVIKPSSRLMSRQRSSPYATRLLTKSESQGFASIPQYHSGSFASRSGQISPNVGKFNSHIASPAKYTAPSTPYSKLIKQEEYQESSRMSVEKLRSSVTSKSLRKMIPMLDKYVKEHAQMTVGDWMQKMEDKRSRKKQVKSSLTIGAPYEQIPKQLSMSRQMISEKIMPRPPSATKKVGFTRKKVAGKMNPEIDMTMRKSKLPLSAKFLDNVLVYRGMEARESLINPEGKFKVDFTQLGGKSKLQERASLARKLKIKAEKQFDSLVKRSSKLSRSTSPLY